MLETLECICGKRFIKRKVTQFSCSGKCGRKRRLTIPRPCECGNMGVYPNDNEWTCEECYKIENKMKYHMRYDYVGTVTRHLDPWDFGIWRGFKL